MATAAANPTTEVEAALNRAGRLLAQRQRAEQEIVDRLGDAGFPAPVVAEAVARLKELRLVDDGAFARAWIEERMRRKGAGPEVLRTELLAKGVDGLVVEEALAEALPDEAARAMEVAASLVGRIGGLPLPKQAARLTAALGRRGFSEEAVEEAVRAVLPPEGWD